MIEFSFCVGMVCVRAFLSVLFGIFWPVTLLGATVIIYVRGR